MLGSAALTVVLLLADTLSTSHPDQLQCEGSFYRRSPPRHITDLGLETRCHHLEERTFTTLLHPDCPHSIHTALHLSPQNDWGKGTTHSKDESWSGQDSHMFIPALYKNNRHVAPSTWLSPLQKMDSLTAEHVESQVIPLCSKTEGEMYVQSGVGGLSECEGEMLWTVVCCAAPDASASFSIGMVMDGEGSLKVISVEELENLVGIGELFPGGCGQGGHEHLQVISQSIEDTMNKQLNAIKQEDESIEETLIEESLTEENANDTESENQESVLLYILSSLFSLLCAPLFLVISILTNFLSQVSYVLQEDAAVLASVPINCLIVVRDVACGVVSWTESLCNLLYTVVETVVGTFYFCISTLVGTFLLSCQELVTGIGTLMSDILGIATGVLELVWDLGGGSVESAGCGLFQYLETVCFETVHQVKTVGGGFMCLMWRSQRGLVHVLYTVSIVISGVLENAVENVQAACGGVENVCIGFLEVSTVVENVVQNVAEDIQEAV
ncbi:uncharacterized protein si:ch73-54f23.2 [Hoplias malabaricus]|uniref:uncharacterized protein si:ch73-54f23.2 n=1 Tax=Hoplias malabaricus TaxID=27720 RepID=UPI003461FAF2